MASETQISIPPHHARRPMNAFLIFCKRHRNVVKDRYPNLENRCITKILGEWWAGLDCIDKSDYTDLAKQYKDAFFTANPDFKWYKLPAPSLRMLSSRPENIPSLSSYYTNDSKDLIKNISQTNDVDSEYRKLNDADKYLSLDNGESDSENCVKSEEDEEMKTVFSPVKLADENQLGNLRNLIEVDKSCNNNNINSSPDVQKDDKIKSFHKFALNNNVSENEDSFVYKNNTKANELEHALHEANSFIVNVFDEHCALSSSHSSLFKEPKISCKKLHKINNFKPSHLSEMGQEVHRDIGYNQKKSYESITSGFQTDHIHDNMCESYSREKTSRSCKGKRYEEFKIKGLISTKPKHAGSNKNSIDLTYSSEEPMKKSTNELCNSDANYGTPLGIVDSGDNISQIISNDFNENIKEYSNKQQPGIPDQARSEMIENKFFLPSDFDLDAKIKALPLLNLEEYLLKKKENKNTKKHIKKHNMKSKLNETQYKSKTHNMNKLKVIRRNNYNEIPLYERETAIGSRKRKAVKQRITHLDLKNCNNYDMKYKSVVSPQVNFLSGLSTLAEVAAKSSKIVTSIDRL